jgi:hypothetical protein
MGSPHGLSLAGSFFMGNKIINSKITAILLGLVLFLLNIALNYNESFWVPIGSVIGNLISVTPLMLVIASKHKISIQGKFTLMFIFAISAQVLSLLGLSLVNLIVLLTSLAILIIRLISGAFKKRA